MDWYEVKRFLADGAIMIFIGWIFILVFIIVLAPYVLLFNWLISK